MTNNLSIGNIPTRKIGTHFIWHGSKLQLLSITTCTGTDKILEMSIQGKNWAFNIY